MFLPSRCLRSNEIILVAREKVSRWQCKELEMAWKGFGGRKNGRWFGASQSSLLLDGRRGSNASLRKATWSGVAKQNASNWPELERFCHLLPAREQLSNSYITIIFLDVGPAAKWPQRHVTHNMAQNFLPTSFPNFSEPQLHIHSVAARNPRPRTLSTIARERQ